MCFYNGIKISRADHIRLKDMEISLSEYDLSLLKPLQSGFDFGDWPVIRPTRDDNHAELMLMHWELIPHYLRTWGDVERFRNGGLNPKTGKKDPPKNTLNAIGEEMLQKPTYRHAALNRRCLILSSFFMNGDISLHLLQRKIWPIRIRYRLKTRSIFSLQVSGNPGRIRKLVKPLKDFHW